MWIYLPINSSLWSFFLKRLIMGIKIASLISCNVYMHYCMYPHLRGRNVDFTLYKINIIVVVLFHPAPEKTLPYSFSRLTTNLSGFFTLKNKVVHFAKFAGAVVCAV